MHHVCLVSDQLVPNVLPAKSHIQGIHADVVTMIVSASMRNKASVLRQELLQNNIKVTEDISISDPNNIPQIEDSVTNWICEHDAQNIALNVTGGTKPMAIAAQHAFQELGKPVFYVDIATDRLVWLDRERRDPVQLENLLSVKAILRLYGLEVLSGDFHVNIDDGWQRYADNLMEKSEWNRALARLNYIAKKCSDSRRNEELDFWRFDTGDMIPIYWDDLMMELQGNGLLSCGERSRFKNVAARDFCAGRWFEYETFKAVKSLGFNARNALMNVIVKDADGNRNEYDAVLSHRNTLYVIECKTRNMESPDVADNAVYKLAQLKQLGGGLRAKGLLVSYMPIRKTDRDRAHAYGVTVIDSMRDIDVRIKNVLGL